MELTLDPVIPMHRKCPDGHVRFNRGYISPNRGKTFDEIFGKERSKEIRMKISRAKKSNPGYMSMRRSKPCLAINGGKIIAIFPSTADASRKMGLHRTAVQKYIHQKAKPKNGWQWFYEAESWKWAELITNQ